jgi:hypothetical protein
MRQPTERGRPAIKDELGMAAAMYGLAVPIPEAIQARTP